MARATTAQPGRLGGVLTWALQAEPESLDPANTVTVVSEAAGRPLHDGLLNFGPGFELQPALAERWVISPDGLRYVFFLRRGVTFHDDTPFDAAAAQYNLERLLGDEKPRRRELLLGIVKGARAIEDYALEVSLEKPFGPLLHHLAQYGAAMVSPEQHRTWKQNYGLHPAGTGPFRLASWERGSQIVLERWDEGWRGQPGLDRLVLRPRPDDGARLSLLESGEAQLAGSVSLELLPRLRTNPRVRLDTVSTARTLGISINTQSPGLADKRVRQALNLAIDREALVASVYQGQAVPLGGPIGPRVAGAAPIKPLPFDPIRSRDLFTAAGFGGGLESVLLGPKGRYPRDAALLQAVQNQLQAAGVKTRLDLADQAQYIQAITRGLDETALKLSLASWLPASGEVRGALYPLFHSSQVMPAGFNASFYKSSQLDGLIDRATSAIDPTERDGLWRQAQDLLLEDAPWIFLLAPKMIVASSTRLHEPFLGASEVVSVTEQTWLE